MDRYSVVGIITLFLVFTSVLLFVFLSTVRTNNKVANRLLAAYFLIFSLHISVFFYSNYIELPLGIERLRDQIMFLSSPILFLYVVASIYIDFKLKWKHLLHVIPFLVAIVIYTPRFYVVSYQKKVEFLNDFNNTLETQLTAVFAGLVILLYLVLMFKALANYKSILNANYSDKYPFNYKWLLQLTILLTIIFVFSQIKQAYVFFGTDIEALNLIRILLTLLVQVFLTWIVFKSLYHPALFRNIDSKHLLAKDSLNDSSKESVPSQAARDLDVFMKTEHPYLDPTLSLTGLALQMNIQPRTLSSLINQEYGCHFFEFINQYRIDKAKHLLEDSSNPKLTVQQIMYESGFNSKSSFYTEFKRKTNQTPTQYRSGQPS